MKNILWVLLLTLSTAALAEPQVTIQSQALVEQESTDAEGAPIIVRVPVNTVDQGAELIFELTITNSSNDDAVNLVINNPIPEGTQYIANSQTGQGSTHLVSWDNNEFLSEAEFLEGELSASDIRHLRWTLDRLKANSSSTLEFRVIIQ